MKPAISLCKLFSLLVFLTTAITASADVIDSFATPQGPFTVGPGEELTDEQMMVFTASVLGGLRAATPQVDEAAQVGSTATMQISGGAFDCRVDFPSLGNLDNFAGCTIGYFPADDVLFDLTESSRFQFDVQSVTGGMDFAVFVIDLDGEMSLGFVENVGPGSRSIPFDELFPVFSLDGPDMSAAFSVGFVVANHEGQEGRVVLTQFATDGAIKAGPEIPVDIQIAAEEIPGTYFNPDRDGEGCQLTRERDQVNFILTCYFYDDGEQFWLIGASQLVNGQIVFDEMTVTSGAQYGDAFDPGDVVRTNWGSATMTWGNCNTATLELQPIVSGYEDTMLDLTRIVPTICGGGGFQGDAVSWMGAYYDPDRDGEGFHFGVEANGIFVMTWYTYLEGRQVWMIGTGTRDGQRVVFSDVVITSGTGFGSQFDPAEVIKEPFGEIMVDFTDCNSFSATIDSQIGDFHDLVLDVTKIVPGLCP